jgi:hypothetical protein
LLRTASFGDLCEQRDGYHPDYTPRASPLAAWAGLGARGASPRAPTAEPGDFAAEAEVKIAENYSHRLSFDVSVKNDSDSNYLRRILALKFKI